MFTIREISGFAIGKSCLGKRCFDSYADAESGIGGLIKKGHTQAQKGVLYPYFCGTHMAWHIGHRRQKGK